MHPRKKINKEEAGLTRTEECAAMLLPSEATTRTSAGDARSAEKSAHGAIASDLCCRQIPAPLLLG